MIRVALAIPTTASWAPGRKESLAKLKQDLGIENWGEGPGTFDIALGASNAVTQFDFFEHHNRSPREVWWETIASWAASTEATHFLQIQDDMRAAPGGLFWRALYAMIEAHPGEILNLQSVHQAAPALAAEGITGYTTSEGMPGPAYVVPVPTLRETLSWRKTALRDGALQKVTEDTLIAVFCLATGRKIWAPVPTIVDHPGEAPSTFGNDVGVGRQDLYATRQRPRVRWDNWQSEGSPIARALSTPGFWRPAPLHLGRFYPQSIPRLARMVVKDYTEADQKRDEADSGNPALRRLFHMRRAKAPDPTARLFVCTPVRGGLSHDYVRSILSLMGEIEGIEVVNEMTLSEEPGGLFFESSDLVRVRSRFVRMARESNCTHLLMVDGDMRFEPVVVFSMLRTGYDFVQAPYPRRDGLGYSIRYMQKTLSNPNRKPIPEDIERDTVEIMGCGLGLTLLSRRCFEKMLDHYGNEPEPPELEEILRSGMNRREMLKAAYEIGRLHPPLVYDDFDKFDGSAVPHKTVGLFQLIIGKDPIEPYTLLSGEDISLCERWRKIGGQVRMYVGEGSPIDHWGEHLYEGRIEHLGLVHQPK